MYTTEQCINSITNCTDTLSFLLIFLLHVQTLRLKEFCFIRSINSFSLSSTVKPPEHITSVLQGRSLMVVSSTGCTTQLLSVVLPHRDECLLRSALHMRVLAVPETQSYGQKDLSINYQ
jgi:hypothetical protein